MVLIKKRAPKGNIRVRDSAKSEASADESTVEISESNEEGPDVNREMLDDIKFAQQLRARKSGSSIDALLAPKKDSKVPGKNSQQPKLEDTVGQQFAAQTDDYHGTVAHEKLMNEFIEGKLGLKEDEESAPKVRNPEDDLYVIPEEFKVTTAPVEGTVRSKEDEDGLGIAAAWSTGIAEVALPIEFKLKNIDATQQALNRSRGPATFSGVSSSAIPPEAFRPPRIHSSADSAQSSSGPARTGGAYYQRFQRHTGIMKRFPGEAPASASSAAIIGGGVGGGGASAGNRSSGGHGPGSGQQNGGALVRGEDSAGAGDGQKKRRPPQSSDDIAMQRFRKRELNYRRNK